MIVSQHRCPVLQVRLWRQPVVETQAIDEGAFLNAAFGMAAQLYMTMKQSNVRVAEQHADCVPCVTPLRFVEERLALAVKRPQLPLLSGI